MTTKNNGELDFSTNKKGTHTNSKTLSRTQDYRRRKALGLVKPRGKKVGQEIKNNPEKMREFLISKNGNYKPHARKVKKVGFFKKVLNVITFPFKLIWSIVKFLFALVRAFIITVLSIILIVAVLLLCLITWKNIDDLLIELGKFGTQNKIDKIRARHYPFSNVA